MVQALRCKIDVTIYVFCAVLEKVSTQATHYRVIHGRSLFCVFGTAARTAEEVPLQIL